MNKKTLGVAIGVVIVFVSLGSFMYLIKKDKTHISERGVAALSSAPVVEELQTENQPQVAQTTPDLQEQDNAKEIDNVKNNENNDVNKTELKNVVVEKSDPNKRISCSMKAKKGSYDDKATISWNCENYIGWTCDFRVQTINKLYKNVQLPSSSMEAKVMQAGMDMAAYCPQGTKSPSPDCEYRDVKVPGYTSYALFCKADDGRKKNFQDYYTNKND